MTMHAAPLAVRAQGRWRGILPQLGISPKYLINRHGPCPICKEGKDRFRFDDKDGRGTYFCSQCGAGDGVKFVMAVNGWDFKEAAQRIEAVTGSAPIQASKPPRDDAACRDDNNRIWRAASPVRPDDPAGRYLFARCGLTEFPKCLRTATDLPYYVVGEPTRYFYALLAKVTAPDGRPATLHRTFLTAEGRHAPVDDPRRLALGPCVKGSAIRLCDVPGEELGIAEGIETAFSAQRLFGIPLWSAINATMLGEFIPPAGVKRVVIFGDADPKFGGQAAAWKLRHRLAVQGYSTELHIPDQLGVDYNDLDDAKEPEREAA
jgi:putative DNA primase/helicase